MGWERASLGNQRDGFPEEGTRMTELVKCASGEGPSIQSAAQQCRGTETRGAVQSWGIGWLSEGWKWAGEMGKVGHDGLMGVNSGA